MPVSRAVLTAVLVALAGCSTGDGNDPAAPAPKPAALTITIPSLEAAIPGCAAPFARLENGGVDVGCGLGCPTASATCTVTCPEYLGLMSATAYQLSIVYLESDTAVASASIGEVSLAPGANQVTVGAGAVIASAQLQALCP